MKQDTRVTALFSGLILAVCCTLGVSLATVQPAHADPAISGILGFGVDQDQTGIGRVMPGGLYDFGRFGVDAHVSFEGFLRINGDKGIQARSISLLDLGVRYAFMRDRFVGPYVGLGASYGLFFGSPRERKVQDDRETCDSAPASPNACTFNINRNISTRLTLGWGIMQSARTTLGIRLDITYWLLSVADFEDQPEGAPIPADIPRPQGSLSFIVALEFMRWR